MNAIRTWTNYNLKNKGLKEVNENKFRAYVGLEMAMSIVQLNDISYYWKTEMFTGHEDFKRTMSRDGFMNNESLHRSIFMVPAIIVAYNMFMNSVDQMDQRRATKM